MSHHGAVAAGHPLTAEAAELILRAGGNAFDAILAAHFAACVAEPVLASPGGGGFMLAQPANGSAQVFDFFVQTPRHKRPADELDFYPILADFGTAQQEFHIGLGACATPGSVRGMFTIHDSLGSLPMREIVAPAVQYARAGVALNALQAYIFSIVAPIYSASPEAHDIYGNNKPAGTLAGEDDVLLQPELADFLECLAIEGDGLFYRGEVAQAIALQCETGGGHLGLSDLESYEVIRRQPLAVNYRGVRFLTNSPPSSGGLLIAFALKLLETVDFSTLEFGSEEHLRLLTEIMAQTNKARLDAHVESGASPTGMMHMLDPAFVDLYRREIQGRAVAQRGTTHISVMDGQGNVAAMTASNGEGCGQMVLGTGMMLNNMLGEEDLNPEGFHCWQPNQRMTSMMAPSLLQWPDGRQITLGSGGSNRIRTAILQTISNLIDFELDLEQAVTHPRIHFEKNRLSIEGGFDQDELGQLLKKFPDHHLWESCNLFFGGVHAVEHGGKVFCGVGDQRRGGVLPNCTMLSPANQMSINTGRPIKAVSRINGI